MIEEIRLLTGSLGRSIPQALFEVGRGRPEELRPAFAAAQREWLLSTDFARTVAVLKARLADATADAACETLLVAHEVGGTDLDRRLAALVEDRIARPPGPQGRRGQAGRRRASPAASCCRAARAWRWPACRSATAGPPTSTASGQLAVVVAIGMVVACWLWAGRHHAPARGGAGLPCLTGRA